MSVSKIVWSSGGESMVAIKSPIFAPPNGSKPAVYYKSKEKLNTLVAKSNLGLHTDKIPFRHEIDLWLVASKIIQRQCT